MIRFKKPRLPFDHDEAVRLYQKGLPLRGVARHLGVGENRIWRILHKRAIPMSPMGSRPIWPRYVDQATSLYESGRSIRQVARQLFVSPHTVWRCLNEAEVERRAR